MKKLMLFPHRFRLVGWIILLPALVLGLACMYFEFSWDCLTVKQGWLYQLWGKDMFLGKVNFTDELAAVGVIAGLLLLVFSAEKNEDEWTVNLRLRALSWAVWWYYGILVAAIVFVHGSEFFSVLVYNMFTLLILFGLRFRYLWWKANKQIEEA
jgi:hypothetical protein